MIQGTQITHANITAGVAAIHALLPAATTFTPLDTIVSAYSLSTTFGRTIAYTALYEGASFATLASSAVYQTGESMSDSNSFHVTLIDNFPRSNCARLERCNVWLYLSYPFSNRPLLEGSTSQGHLDRYHQDRCPVLASVSVCLETQVRGCRGRFRDKGVDVGSFPV